MGTNDIPYIGLIMTKQNPGEYPRYSLPVGFRFRMYKAVNIYLKFGFIPYKGEKPKEWQCMKSWNEDIFIGWKTTMDKINEYESGNGRKFC